MDDRPRAGFAIKTPCTVQGAKATLYLNFCHHPGITMPTDRRGRPITEDQLHRGVGFLQIPIDVGTWRKVPASETDKLEYICDVIFCEVLIQRLMHDDYCKANQEFRPHLFELAMKTIETSLPSLQIERTVKLVKKCRYVHAMRTSGGYDTPEKFQELKGAAYADEPKPAPQAEPEPAPTPLIEEKAQKKKPSAVKKGFFNDAKGKSLYGPEGSAEGVLPENAGDPLGYIPKSLREKCKIVDSNNPQYQQAQTQQTASQKQKAEFDKMFGDLGSSFERPSVFGEDGLVKDDDDGIGKYSNDYSRFDKLDDVEEPKGPTVPERDFYYDEKGNVIKLDSAPPAPQKPAPVPKTAPAGYPPSQSGPADSAGLPDERAKKAAEATELLRKLGMATNNGDMTDIDTNKVLEELGGLSDAEKQFLAEMEPQMDEAMKQMNGQSSPPPRPDAPEVKKGFLLEQMEKNKAADKKQGTTAGSDSRAAPQYTIACNADVRVVVSMPLITSIKNVDLDVAARSLRIACPEYLLECELPCRVDPAQSKASFKKASRELVLTIPTAKG
jgi:hypothetical protein